MNAKLTRSQLAALKVFREGGNAWRPMGYKGKSAWLCPVSGKSKKVSASTMKVLESAGYIEGYERDSDWVWRLVESNSEIGGEISR